MIPILFNKDEKTFTSLGLGQMDATLVEVERERNGNYTLYAEVPFNSPQAKHLTKEMLIKADAGSRTKWQTFKINRTIKDTNADVIKVYADHISMDTINDAINPKVAIRQQTAEGALRQWANSLVSGKTYDVQSDITHVGSTDWTIDEVENARQALGGVSGSILDVWGGEYEFDNNTIILHKEMGRTAPTVLEYGRNIVSLEYEELIDGVYTSIYPYATYTPKSEDNTQLPDIMVTLDELIVDSEYAGNYETRRIQIVDFSGEFDSNAENPEIPTQDKLRTLATAYVKNNGYGIPKISQEIDFVDLSKTLDYQDIQVMEEIELNDRVPVYYPNIDAETNDVKVTTTNWDVLNNRYSKITLSTIGAMKSNSITSKLSTAIKDLKAEQKKINNTVPYLINSQGNRVWHTTPDDNMEHKIDDTWFKKNGKYTIIYKWNGSMWEEVLNDETFITELETEVAKAQEEAEKASQSAQDADARAGTALEKAGANANLLDTHQNTLNTINNTTIPNINSSISNAMSEARRALSSAGSAMDEAKRVDGKVETFKTDIGETISDVNSKAQKAIDDVGLVDGKVETFKTDIGKTISTISDSAKLAMDEAQKADGKIADYVTRNGLVSGTTVDSKINDATGEWSQNLSRVEGKIPTSVGGRNYLLNSGKTGALSIHSNNGSVYPVTRGVENGVDWFYQSYIDGTDRFMISTYIGEVYTNKSNFGRSFSKDLEGYDGIITYSVDVMSEEPITLRLNLSSAGRDNQTTLVPNQWTRLVTTMPITDYPRPMAFMADVNDNVSIPMGTKLYWKNYKIEKGNVATDYSLAPEDNYTQEEFKIFEASYNSSVEGIDAKLGTVSNKVDDNGKAFTEFKENEYKRTAERVSDTFTKSETTTMLGGKADASQLSNYLAKSTYERDAEESKERFETIESDLDNISVGGRNLLQGTSNEWKILTMGAGNWFTNFGYDENYKVEVGQTYTFSIVVDKVDSNDTVPINLHLGLSSVRGSYTYDIVTWRQNNIPMGKKVSITYTITENDVDNGARPWFAYRLRNEQKATHVKYKEAKLEKGTIATDWSPAVENMANLSYVSSEITKSAEAIKTSLANYAKTTDLNGLATETYATNQAVSEAGKVKNELTKYAKTTDLTGLASETYATNVAVNEATKVSNELTKYAKTTDLTGLATETYAQTQATTEAGKVEQKLTGYAKTTDLNGLATETYATNKAVSEAGKVSSELTKYELKTGVDSKISTASSALRTETAEKMKTVYTKSETNTLLGKKADSSSLNNYVQTATYESGIDGVSQSLSRVEGKVDGLQVGGRNLIPQSDFNNGVVTGGHSTKDGFQFNGVTYSNENGEFRVVFPTNGVDTSVRFVFWSSSNKLNAQKGDKITLSFKGRTDSENNLCVRTGGTFTSPVTKIAMTSSDDIYTVTFEAPIKVSNGAFVFWLENAGVVVFDWMKLELGSIATDWTPAPEDTLTQDEYKAFKSDYESTVEGITGQITSLSTSKLDGNTYTNFLANDYKATADKATSAFTKVDKIVDANGNVKDNFSKAVYDQNATRQSADFQNVTKDLVKTATYTAGINGINQSITSVEGKIPTKIGTRNYFVNYTAKKGHLLSWASGAPSNETDSLLSDFISVSAGDKFVSNEQLSQVMFYDANKNYLGALTANGTLSKTFGNTFSKFEVPTGQSIGLMRFTVRNGFMKDITIADVRIMLTKGDVVSDWELSPEDREVGGTNIIKDSQNLTSSNNGSATLNIPLEFEEPLISGEVYTISFDIKSDSPTSSNRLFLTSSMIIYRDITFTTDWKRHSFTFVYDGSNYYGYQIRPHLYPDSSISSHIRYVRLEKGMVGNAWGVSPQDIVSNSDYKVFKNDYTETAQRIENRLTAIDSSAEGSVVTRLNKTESTASGNSQLIATINSNYVKQSNIDASILADKKIKDTRSTTQLPSWYFTNYPAQEVREFKQVSTMGVGSGSYGILTTNVPWTSTSGGTVKQTFETNTETYVRQGNSAGTIWGAWSKQIDTSDTTYQKITQTSSLYERVLGSTSESGVKNNISSIVQTSEIIQQTVTSAMNVENRNLLVTKSAKNDTWLVGSETYPNPSVATNSGVSTSPDLIAVSAGDKFTLSKNETTLFFRVSFLNSEKKYIGRYTQNAKSAVITPPANTAYLWVSYPANADAKIEKGSIYTGYSPAPEDTATQSQITQLADNINLRVSKSDLISQINVQAGSVLIQSGTNKLNITPTTTYIQNGTIESAMIKSLDAGKITAGTLDASKVTVTNLDANNITANKTSFVQSAWNGINNTVSVNANGIRSANTNGDWALYHSGAISFGGGSSQGIYLEYADSSRNGLAINNRGALNTDITLDLMSSARNTINFGRRTDTNGYDFRIDHYQGTKVSFDGRGVQRYTFNVNSDSQSHAISILGHGATSGYNSGSGLSIGMETADGVTKGSRFYFSSTSDLVWLGKNSYSDLKPLAVFDLQFRWGQNGRKSMKTVLEYLSRASGVDINNIPDV